MQYSTACMPSIVIHLSIYISRHACLVVAALLLDARATKCLLLLLAVFSFDVTYACYAAAFTLPHQKVRERTARLAHSMHHARTHLL